MFAILVIGCTPQSTVLPAKSSANPTVSTVEQAQPEENRERINATAEARSVSLNGQDIPAGFILVPPQNGPVDNRKAAADRPNPQEHFHLLEKWGRLGGYHSFFVADTKSSGDKSVAIIQSFVSVYKAADGAKQYFEYASTNVQPQMTKFVVPQVGDQAIGFKNQGQPGQQTGYVFHFQRQNVVATIILVGQDSVKNEETATFLARVMDKKISDSNKKTF